MTLYIIVAVSKSLFSTSLVRVDFMCVLIVLLPLPSESIIIITINIVTDIRINLLFFSFILTINFLLLFSSSNPFLSSFFLSFIIPPFYDYNIVLKVFI